MSLFQSICRKDKISHVSHSTDSTGTSENMQCFEHYSWSLSKQQNDKWTFLLIILISGADTCSFSFDLWKIPFILRFQFFFFLFKVRPEEWRIKCLKISYCYLVNIMIYLDIIYFILTFDKITEFWCTACLLWPKLNWNKAE